MADAPTLDEIKAADEPSSSDVHVDVPLGSQAPAKKRNPALRTTAFVRKLKEKLMAAGVSADDMAAAVAAARGHAGGSAARGSEPHRTFVPFAASEGDTPGWIPYMPVPGSYAHPSYGEVNLSAARLAHFAQNFNSGIYQSQVPLDGEHMTKESGAMAWIKELRQNENGSLDARVEWTDRGALMLAEKRFKFISPEWYDEWTDPATNKVYRDVAIGGAMTTRPFFKEGVLAALAASGDWPMYPDPDAPESQTEGQEDATDLLDQIADMVADGLTTEEIIAAVTAGDAYVRGVYAAYNRSLGPAAVNTPYMSTEARKASAKAKGATPMAEEKTTPEGTPGTAVSPTPVAAPAAVPTPEVTPMPAQASERIAMAEAEAKRMGEELKKANERIVAIEAATRVKRFTDEVMGRTDQNGTRWFGEIAGHVTFLEDLSKAFGEESDQVKHYITDQRARAVQVQQFTSRTPEGVGGFAPGGAMEKIAALTKKAREDNPKLTEATAQGKVLSEHPDLYAEYKKER